MAPEWPNHVRHNIKFILHGIDFERGKNNGWMKSAYERPICGINWAAIDAATFLERNAAFDGFTEHVISRYMRHKRRTVEVPGFCVYNAVHDGKDDGYINVGEKRGIPQD